MTTHTTSNDNSLIEQQEGTALTSQGQTVMSQVADVNLDFELTHPELLGKGEAVDVTPDPTLMPKTGQVGYTIEEAVAELADNSVDSVSDETVEINITFGGIGGETGLVQYVEVVDNGRGMTLDQAKNAVVLGKSNKDNTKIGKFGIGMKGACTFLGKRFVVETATAEDDQATMVVYDEDQFLQKNKWELTAYRVPKKFNHGTRIRIERLNVNLKGHGQGAKLGNTPTDRTERLLARQHRTRLQRGDAHIYINFKPVSTLPPVWDPKYAPVLQQFDFQINGKRVHGVAGVILPQDKGQLARGEDYGFDLIRNERITLEFEKIGFNPHHMMRNVYGMIHLDGFEVTSNKRDFIRDTDEWVELDEQMRAVMKPIVRAISKYYDDGPGNKKNKSNADKYQLVWDKTGGKDVIEWVLPSEQKPELDLLSSGSEPEDESKTKGAEQQSQDDIEEYSLTPDEDHHNQKDMTSPAASNTQEVFAADEQKTGFFNHSVEATDKPQPTLNRDLPEAAPSLPPGEFVGQLRTVNYRHQIAHYGDNPYKTWEIVKADDLDVISVTTNLDHGFFQLIANECIQHWYKHNVAEAIAEYLVNMRGLEESMLNVKDRLLIDLA